MGRSQKGAAPAGPDNAADFDGIRPLRRVVLREELVAITENFQEALVLGQMLYWAERCYEWDSWVVEERQRRMAANLPVKDLEPRHGWIYKSSVSLSDELMTGWSKATVLRHLDALVQRGYLQRRPSSNGTLDRTFEYRVDLPALKTALEKAGYDLPEWRFAAYRQPTEASRNQPEEFQNETGRTNELDKEITEMGIDTCGIYPHPAANAAEGGVGEGDATSQPKPERFADEPEPEPKQRKRKRAPRPPDAIDTLCDVFSAASGVPLPQVVTSKDWARYGDQWRTPLKVILALARQSESDAAMLIRKAIAEMDRKQLIISSPLSILKLCTHLARKNHQGPDYFH